MAAGAISVCWRSGISNTARLLSAVAWARRAARRWGSSIGATPCSISRKERSTTPSPCRDPIGIVALLNHRPGVALNDHRQSHQQRLAEAAGPRLADKIVGQAHEVVDLARESLDVMREWQPHRRQSLFQRLVMTADKDELRVEPRGGDPPGHPHHPPRAEAPEHHQPGRQVGPQTQPAPRVLAREISNGW